MSDEDGYLSRSTTIKAYNNLVKGVCIDEAYRDSQHVTVHVPLTLETEDSVNEMCLRRQRSKDSNNAVCLTPETKDSIDKEPLTKMPKSTTLTNAACSERVHEGARTDFYYFSDVPVRDDTDQKACEEQFVIINTPGQKVNDFAELVFDMVSR